MDPILKREWLKALRSGKYKQGKYQLRNQDDTYCCLGVLCDVAGKLSGIGVWNLDTTGLTPDWKFINELNHGERSCGFPDLDLMDLFGLDGDFGRDLAAMNDGQDKTFAEIADVVEKTV